MKEQLVGRYLVDCGAKLSLELDINNPKLRRAVGEVRMSLLYAVMQHPSQSCEGYPMVTVDWIPADKEDEWAVDEVLFSIHCVYDKVTEADTYELLGELTAIIQEEIFHNYIMKGMWGAGVTTDSSVEPDLKTKKLLENNDKDDHFSEAFTNRLVEGMRAEVEKHMENT